jgi:hypothetical protein
MTEATAPAPAPAVEAPAPAPAAPSPAPAAPAPAPESLLSKPTDAPAPPADAPAPAPAPADEFAWLPEKYRVMNDKGELDLAASSKKLGEGYGNLSKKLGTGEVPPETPDAYAFTTPEQFKDVPMDEGLMKGFRERAHKVGLNQGQFEFVMGEYFDLVPQVLNAAANLTATEARAELSKVWATPAEFDAGIAAADRAIASSGEELGGKLWEKFGRDPDFIRFAASLGQEMKEDRSPNNTGSGAGDDIGALLAHPAVRDPKHPEHAKVSKQIADHFNKKHGAAPAFQ